MKIIFFKPLIFNLCPGTNEHFNLWMIPVFTVETK